MAHNPKYNLTPPTLDEGQEGQLQIDSSGNLKITGSISSVLPGSTATSLGKATSAAAGAADVGVAVLGIRNDTNAALSDAAGDYTPLGLTAQGEVKVAGALDGTAFASAARTATPTPFDLVNYRHKGLHLVIDCTAVTATPSVVFTIQGKDEVSGKFYTILASAAITGTGTTVLRVYPGLTAAANTVASDVLPRQWRLIATHGDADSITYSVGYSLVL